MKPKKTHAYSIRRPGNLKRGKNMMEDMVIDFTEAMVTLVI